jgi:hypothetical protein
MKSCSSPARLQTVSSSAGHGHDGDDQDKLNENAMSTERLAVTAEFGSE